MSDRPLYRLAGQLLLGVLIFIAIDRLVFTGTLYYGWVAPDSSLGRTARPIRETKALPKDGKTILVLGDSRITEGFSPRLANEDATQAGSALHFASAAVPGSTSRVWYYLLRAVQPQKEQLAAIVIGLDSYHDNIEHKFEAEGIDISMVHPLLSLSDLADFPASFLRHDNQLRAVEAILFRGRPYAEDIQDFLSAPAARVKMVKAGKEHGAEWVWVYPGRNETLGGTTLDINTGHLSASPAQKTPRLQEYAETLSNFYGIPPERPDIAAFRRTWIGRVAALCQQAGVKLFAIRVPRGPLHSLGLADTTSSGAVAELEAAGALTLLPADLANALERPEFFFDELHMNAAGRQAFSHILAGAMLPRLSNLH
jgi:hypothetical protein